MHTPKLNKYQVLHKSLSGFRKHHSCNTALINLVDKWLKNIDNGKVVGAIFFNCFFFFFFFFCFKESF